MFICFPEVFFEIEVLSPCVAGYDFLCLGSDGDDGSGWSFAGSSGIQTRSRTSEVPPPFTKNKTLTSSVEFLSTGRMHRSPLPQDEALHSI